MTILITGGAGYIGSHTLIELSKVGYDFVVFDNLSNSCDESLKRVSKLINKDVKFVKGDIRDRAALKACFEQYKPDSVIHFAGLKAVGESVVKPIEYYDNNVNGTLVLLDVMREYNCKKIIFSSSATVYGNPNAPLIKEDFPVGGTTNPYGTSKYFIERILQDCYVADNKMQIVLLRYFNPVGAHESGMIGEDSSGIPNNLMPYISQVAVRKRPHLNVFGNDYPTRDGTGVRDYLHVVDLAIGHVKALDYLNAHPGSKPLIVNLGTGNGCSVLELVHAFEKVNGIEIPYKIVDRRPGDLPTVVADPSYAKEVLGWTATKTIEDMVRDSWNWQSHNPNGYRA
ncbi:galactose epimerase, putative [Trichomonas vaginalis G3]|uniref:UDP-glucose 4-epimerase n=1 Tax=Trichomonas vaginalis (strain ATCC PRA-98 / G3) TaxID=412133 RepID=A2DJP4_TRIV3|nr:UDP-glucose 4-epimerase family [Trichomonas vaginalis G3]EAY19444.1 galactose epimerase, putative [Trichomonas vaginalis G3]KAI5493149.1 UDP-glucose 4-epimerase family [Trichomonas vaginalis G3]|eukprot:XP_001580430.1 galactose epimerase [Trichomonas vaginalis G3]